MENSGVRGSVLLAVLLGVLILSSAGCASDGASSNDAEQDSTNLAASGEAADGATGPAPQTTGPVSDGGQGDREGQTTSDASAGSDDAVQPDGGRGSGDPGGTGAGAASVPDGRVLIRFQGDEGAGFTGTCTVTGDREDVEGTVPDQRSYRLSGGGELSCELRKTGEGLLRVVLTSGDDRSVYQVNAPDSRLGFSYSGSGASSTTHSSSSASSSDVSSGSSSSVTSSNSSSSSSSSVVVQQNSRQSSSSTTSP